MHLLRVRGRYLLCAEVIEDLGLHRARVLEHISTYLQDKPTERKALSHYGALRLQRAEAMEIIGSGDSLGLYFTWVIRDRQRGGSVF